MALKRVCDITGIDVDVEICDVTIAGQTIKLDLAPAGADRLVEFFGKTVTVRHPRSSASSVASSAAASSSVDAAGDDEVESDSSAAADLDDEIEASSEAASEAAEVAEDEPAAALTRRSGRRGRAVAKPGRKKTAGRRVAKAPVPGSAEIREWARANGFEVGDRGAIPGRIRSAFTLAHE